MNIRTITLMGTLLSASLLWAQQSAPSDKTADTQPVSQAAAACPGPSANTAANQSQAAPTHRNDDDKTNTQGQQDTVNDPSANDQPLQSPQDDPNKSPWWEPRDWNYINSL